MNNIFPYVYRVDNQITGEFYYGYREANKIRAVEDILKYKTSKPSIHENFHNFKVTMIQEFSIGNDAYNYEQFLIHSEWKNPLLLNESCFYNKKQFKYKKGKTLTVKHRTNIALSATGRKHSEESKRKMGKNRTKEHCENISKALKGKSKPEYFHKKRGSYKQKEHTFNICNECGIRFKKNRKPSQKFCSPFCYYKHKQAQL